MNHNNNDNALLLLKQFLVFSDFVFVTDSGSVDQEWFFHKTETSFYRGNLDKASFLYLNTKCKGCLYICSDVIITEEATKDLISKLSASPPNIMLYTPVVNGKSHGWLKKQGTGLREIPFAEGMIFYASGFLIEAIYNLFPMKENQLGWGLDMWWGYIARQKLFGRIVIDEDCQVYHPEQTNYDTGEANQQMRNYISKQEDGFKVFCQQTLGVVV
jgi:hypothetical protein